MKYLFLIGTQHHLVQLNAALVHFNILPENAILVFITNSNEDISDKLIEYNHLSCVKVFKNWVFKDLLTNRSKHRTFIRFIKNLSPKEKQFTVFSTISFEATLLVKTLINVNKLYLMDDGLGHFTTYYLFKSPKRFIYILQLFFKSVLYGRYLTFSTDFIYFTEHEFIVKHAEQALKYKIEKQDNTLERFISNEVIFLGTCLVDVKLMTFDNYMQLLIKVKDIFHLKKIFYLPHRNESPSLLKEIAALGFIIQKIDEPFETYFSKLKVCPSIISSFYTTAVIQNLATRFKILPTLKAVKFDKRLFLKPQKEYEAIYQQMVYVQEIEIIDLSNNETISNLTNIKQ
jgi:hypothetical protein